VRLRPTLFAERAFFYLVREAQTEIVMRVREKNLPLLIAMASQKKTGKTLSEESGVSRATISLLLNQRTDKPKTETAMRIAAALGTTPSKLGWSGGDHE
jgi:DNA-binding Xre family transcriptional regulator